MRLPVAGTASLLRNSVFGIFDGVSRITGSVGKGLAEATLDDSFKERRLEDQRNKPSNVVTGMASGALTIGKGIGSGIAGVFTMPVAGARSGGALGFIKGVGAGVVGVVTKPVVSVFDGATQGALGTKRGEPGENPWLVGIPTRPRPDAFAAFEHPCIPIVVSVGVRARIATDADVARFPATAMQSPRASATRRTCSTARSPFNRCERRAPLALTASWLRTTLWRPSAP